jgi:hypothetical protein
MPNDCKSHKSHETRASVLSLASSARRLASSARRLASSARRLASSARPRRIRSASLFGARSLGNLWRPSGVRGAGVRNPAPVTHCQGRWFVVDPHSFAINEQGSTMDRDAVAASNGFAPTRRALPSGPRRGVRSERNEIGIGNARSSDSACNRASHATATSTWMLEPWNSRL